MQIHPNTLYIKNTAHSMGFEYCGIAKAIPLHDEAKKLENWLNQGYHGKMAYMENHFDLRIDPTKLVPGAKSVITLLYNYFPDKVIENPEVKISKYAYGDDYHEIIRTKLKEFLNKIQLQLGDINGRGFVDSAPVMERAWAQKSGLGWIGKNAHLIHKGHGSFFFIATLIVDIELEYDNPLVKDYCGSCTRCIDACPTDAIIKPGLINGSQCISYLTIELKDEIIPDEFNGKVQNWMFGCDVCQDVCPWNRFSTPHEKPELNPNNTMLSFSINDWLDLEEDTFKKLLKHSPLKRSKWKGIRRNVQFIKNIQKGDS